jgi:hypothetical protein
MDLESRPPAIHEIAAYTELLEIKGEIKAWPPRRVLDVLNNKQTELLTVEQASVIPLSRWGKAQPSAVENITLNKQEIVFVWPIRETEVETTEFVTTHKLPRDIMAYAGPFILQGTLHVIREASLDEAWDIIKEDFIALTSPSVLCLTVPELSLNAGPVVTVNKHRTMAIHARK